MMHMGRFSESVFGRKVLPERCLIYAGEYVPQRIKWVENLFDKWDGIKGNWLRYCFAAKDGLGYLLIFGCYGGAICFETLRLLRDGNTKKVFFIGSMGAKQLPIGTLVIPTTVIDKAGLVLLDNPERQSLEVEPKSLIRLQTSLKTLGQEYIEGKIVSVPCVLHGIDHIKNFIKQDTTILGVEMETSTFYHYSQKDGLENYALLWVSDNREHDVISQAKSVRDARRTSIKTITKIAIETLK
jgi:purine-nucleoside phosphorylase